MRPDGDNKTPSLVVFGEQAIALLTQHVDHKRRIAAVFKYQFQRIAAIQRSLTDDDVLSPPASP
ncbi:Uncharacterised protein [Escherichia coli]|nr:Uncharacterised protein [Escherichia coli]